jgi:hypothetical protein
MMPRFLRASSRAVLAIALACSVLQPSVARATDYTDIWWAGPSENGWGVNFTQNENVIFATFFVYDQSKLPSWYVAIMYADSNGNYSGSMFRTSGTFFVLPWAPIDYSAVSVGAASFFPSSATAGTLSYIVDKNPPVTKSIQRQTLTSIILGGVYVGGQTGGYSGSSCKSPGGYVDTYDTLQVTQSDGTNVTLAFTYSSFTCTFSGELRQSGQLYGIPSASYVCSTGLNTTARMYEIKATSLGIEGRFTAPSVGSGCQEDANFSAVLR